MKPVAIVPWTEEFFAGLAERLVAATGGDFTNVLVLFPLRRAARHLCDRLAARPGLPLPLILPVLSWWRRGRVTRVDLVRTVPFLMVSLVLGLVTLWYQMGHSSSASSGPLAAVLASLPRGGVLAGRAVGFYLCKDFWPTQLAMVYGVWPLETARPMAYLPTLVVAAAVAGLWWQRKE